MNKHDIENILSQPYKREDWIDLLQNVFSKGRLYTNVKEIKLGKDFVKSSHEIGTFETSDERVIGVYEIVLDERKKIERNRVELRNLLKKYYKQIDGAFVVYRQGSKWRFSYISEISTRNSQGKRIDERTASKRYTYVLGEDEAVHTAVDRFFSLIYKDVSIIDIKDAFSVEKITKEFFDEIALLFTTLVGGERKIGSKIKNFKRELILPYIKDKKKFQEFGVRLIGRIIFCWFLKKKKSAKGISLIPSNLLSLEGVNVYVNYYHSVLEKIFFEALNTPIEARKQEYKTGEFLNIPFLNGGLFEPHTDDYYKPNLLNSLVIPDSWFRKFFEILEMYNFTIDENTSVDVELSLDPEILGRIFENLLAEINPETGNTARKSTGSYYTPRVIVEYMVDESLKLYLEKATGIYDSRLEKLISFDSMDENTFSKHEKEKIIAALDEVKILDPACGSGAFPIGILQKMVLILQKIDKNSKLWLEKVIRDIQDPILKYDLELKYKNKNLDYIRKLGLIQKCIYGVDIQVIATELSKLRAFLTLIVDEEIDDSREDRGIIPLPNLEFKFVSANTLISLPKDEIKLSMFGESEYMETLEKLREQYFISYGKSKLEIENKFKEIQNSLSKIALKSKNTRAEYLSNWEPFGNVSSEWFDSKWMFGVEDGFNIIIGNPPYLKERGNKNVFNKVNNSEFGKKYHEGKMDYWYYFLHKAIDLVTSFSVITFITSRYWLNSKGSKKLIKRINENLSFQNVIDIGKVKVFESVVGHHMVAIYSNSMINEFVYKKVINDYKDIYNMESTENVDIKVLKNTEVFYNNEIIFEERIKFRDTIKLGEICSTSIGVQESPDRININGKDQGVFVLSEKEYKTLKLNNWEKNIVYKYLDSSDVYKYGINNKHKKFIIYSDKDIKDEIRNNIAYKNIKKHLDNYREFVTSSNKPYGIHRPRNLKYFENPKIIFKGMFREPEFTYDDQNYIVGFSFSLIIQDDKEYFLKYILALLNSNFASRWFYIYGKKRGVGVDIGVEKLREFPIKKIEKSEQMKFVKIVEKILEMRSSTYQADIMKEESKLNDMVESLYN